MPPLKIKDFVIHGIDRRDLMESSGDCLNRPIHMQHNGFVPRSPCSRDLAVISSMYILRETC